MTELSPAEASAIVGDDIEYWLANPFMTPALLAKKAAFWVAAARAEVRDMRTKIETLHQPHRDEEAPEPWCREDGRPWPCPTTRALAALLADGGEPQ